VVVCEPVGYHDAKHNKHWMAAMKEEMSLIEKKRTWELVDIPYDRKIIRVQWGI